MTTENTQTTSTTAATTDAAATGGTSQTAENTNTNQGAQTATDDKSTILTDSANGQDGATGTDAADKTDQASGDDKSKGEGSDDKSKEGKDEAQAQTYEAFKLPEGMELDQDAMNRALPVLQKYNLPQEAAQELVTIAADMLSKSVKGMGEQHSEMVTKWHDATVAEFGKEGEAAFNTKVEKAQNVMTKFFSPDELKSIREYGIGNMPGLFRLAYQVALASGEDKGGLQSSTGTAKGEETLGDIWYPKT